MATYATASELASYLQQDLDTSSATLAITIASDLFADHSGTRFESTSTTYSKPGTGASEIILPLFPVIAVQAVRIKGVAVTDYSVIGQSVYRRTRFGSWWSFPPDLVEIDYTYGYTTVPDGVKGAVLETAASVYQNPDFTMMIEQIDDYTSRTKPTAGGFQLSPAAQALAEYYRGTLIG